MARFDYDVALIGSASAEACPLLPQEGYRVGVMESGRRWRDEDMPKT